MVSVVIPLFNKAPHIGRALESALAQTTPALEIIVVNDGSTDGGEEVVKNFQDSRIRLINQKNQGSCAARNRGIDLAQSPLIAFLDADDAWKPGFLETVLQLHQTYPQAGAYATAYDIVMPNGERRMREFSILPPGQAHGLIANYFREGLTFPVTSSTVMIPKRVFAEVGGFPVGEVLCEDLDMWLRIALRYPIAWSSDCLATYHLDATNRVGTFRRLSDEPMVSRTAREAIASGLVPPEQVRDLREYVAYWQLAAAADCLLLGKKETALRLLGYSRGMQKYAWWWWRLRLTAAIPGNAGPWLWKVKQHLWGRSGKPLQDQGTTT